MWLAAPANAQIEKPRLDKTGSTAQPPTTETPREGCVTAECHPGIKDRPNLHGPILVNGCDACHQLTDPAKHVFKPVRDRSETCTLCHAQKTEGLFAHDPRQGRVPGLPAIRTAGTVQVPPRRSLHQILQPPATRTSRAPTTACTGRRRSAPAARATSPTCRSSRSCSTTRVATCA